MDQIEQLTQTLAKVSHERDLIAAHRDLLAKEHEQLCAEMKRDKETIAALQSQIADYVEEVNCLRAKLAFYQNTAYPTQPDHFIQEVPVKLESDMKTEHNDEPETTRLNTYTFEHKADVTGSNIVTGVNEHRSEVTGLNTITGACDQKPETMGLNAVTYVSEHRSEATGLDTITGASEQRPDFPSAAAHIMGDHDTQAPGLVCVEVKPEIESQGPSPVSVCQTDAPSGLTLVTPVVVPSDSHPAAPTGGSERVKAGSFIHSVKLVLETSQLPLAAASQSEQRTIDLPSWSVPSTDCAANSDTGWATDCAAETVEQPSCSTAEEPPETREPGATVCMRQTVEQRMGADSGAGLVSKSNAAADTAYACESAPAVLLLTPLCHTTPSAQWHGGRCVAERVNSFCSSVPSAHLRNGCMQVEWGNSGHREQSEVLLVHRNDQETEQCSEVNCNSAQSAQHDLPPTATKSHACSACGVTFKRAVSLRSHMSSHRQCGAVATSGTLCSGQRADGDVVNGMQLIADRNIVKTRMLVHTGEKPHRCRKCKAAFSKRDNLKRHMLIHTSEKPHRCIECNAAFKERGTLKRHMLIHTGEKPHRCTECNAAFTVGGNLKTHMLIHTGEKPHKCTECKAALSGKSNLKKQTLIHTGEKPHRCRKCKAAFSPRHNLKKHMMIHTGERPHICINCKAAFSVRGNLTRHMLIHTGEKPHRCTECKAAFSMRGNLTRHMLIHTGEKPHRCTDCKAAFSQRGGLKRHMLIHTGEKPHKCTECKAAFSVRGDLKTHMLIHTGERPHTCIKCEAAFRERVSLKRHMLIHTGEKPHKCTECKAAFSVRSNLTRHMLIHTGEKPHRCTECKAAFSQRGSLKRHMLLHTGGKSHR